MKAVCIKNDKQFGFVKGHIYDVYETPFFGEKHSIIKYTVSRKPKDLPFGMDPESFEMYFLDIKKERKLKLEKIYESNK